MSSAETASEDPVFAGMRASKMARVAARHGHVYGEALDKILRKPGPWISAVRGWLATEAAIRRRDARILRDDTWEPNDRQCHIIRLVDDKLLGQFPEGADAPMYAHNRTSTRTLIKRGFLRRIEYSGVVEYTVLRRLAAHNGG